MCYVVWRAALPLCKYAIAVDDKVAVLLLSSEVLDWTSEQKFLTKDSNWFFTSCQNCQAFYFSLVFDAWWSHTEPRILFLSIKFIDFILVKYIFLARKFKLVIWNTYLEVQSWKAMHLPTLDIRVEQKGNRALRKPGLVPVSPCWGEVRSGHFQFRSGISIIGSGQIRSLPV